MGLSLLIDTTGSKGWRFRYRFAGKPKMISFGVYGDVSLAQARAVMKRARCWPKGSTQVKPEKQIR